MAIQDHDFTIKDQLSGSKKDQTHAGEDVRKEFNSRLP